MLTARPIAGVRVCGGEIETAIAAPNGRIIRKASDSMRLRRHLSMRSREAFASVAKTPAKLRIRLWGSG